MSNKHTKYDKSKNQKVTNDSVSSIEIENKETEITKKTIKKVKISGTNVESLETLLQGKTLQVYWYILEKGMAGIREIQKELEFSSAGIVSYQIQKLMVAGLVAKDEESEKYIVLEKVTPGIMKFFIQINNILVPRFSVYLIIFLVGHFIYLMSAFLYGDSFISHQGSSLYLISLIVGTLVSTYESTKMWEMRPN